VQSTITDNVLFVRASRPYNVSKQEENRAFKLKHTMKWSSGFQSVNKAGSLIKGWSSPYFMVMCDGGAMAGMQTASALLFAYIYL